MQPLEVFQSFLRIFKISSRRTVLLVSDQFLMEEQMLISSTSVDFGIAQQTARLVKNCRQYITNGMYHNALRSKTDDILKELFALRDDPID
jgi:hypothetical protein